MVRNVADHILAAPGHRLSQSRFQVYVQRTFDLAGQRV